MSCSSIRHSSSSVYLVEALRVCLWSDFRSVYRQVQLSVGLSVCSSRSSLCSSLNDVQVNKKISKPPPHYFLAPPSPLNSGFPLSPKSIFPRFTNHRRRSDVSAPRRSLVFGACGSFVPLCRRDQGGVGAWTLGDKATRDWGGRN